LSIQKAKNQYLEQVWAVLPRLLACFNTDPISPTFGQGDRYRWAWKLIDFGNGTFQGAANGLARLINADLLPPYLPTESALRRINAIVQGADALRRADGSMEEALPYEASFCVTALVAYDILTAVELLQGKWLSQEMRTSWLAVVRPMIRFLHTADETHGFISNHLATAAVALYKWQALTGEEGQSRGSQFLKRILDQQSQEGWFREYEGADPGYQSLCTYYLADLFQLCPDLPLAEPLTDSLRFLWYFAHPDGSFGGYYGSRNTRFYVPAGVEFMAKQCSEASALADFMHNSISERSVVTLDVMDPPNIVPLFNAYCWAAVIRKNHSLDAELTKPEMPCCSAGPWQRQFPEAGLFIDRGANHYTIISSHKGGVTCHFSPGKTFVDAGIIVRDERGRLYSSQAYQLSNLCENNGRTITVISSLTAVHHQTPTPLQFIILRLLSMTVMRQPAISRLIKKLLVRLLITGGRSLQSRNRRVIRIGEQCTVADFLESTTQHLQQCSVTAPFSAIHMASQGYWQTQDEL
jgi:hypothetical protein